MQYFMHGTVPYVILGIVTVKIKHRSSRFFFLHFSLLGNLGISRETETRPLRQDAREALLFIFLMGPAGAALVVVLARRSPITSHLGVFLCCSLPPREALGRLGHGLT